MPATATATLMNQISKGRKARPRRVMLYGTHGIGKSTFGAMAEKPIFVPTEDGLADIDCESFPLARSLGEVMAALESLYSGDHDYRTVVIDSLDWLERLIWAEVKQVARSDEGNYPSVRYMYCMNAATAMAFVASGSGRPPWWFWLGTGLISACMLTLFSTLVLLGLRHLYTGNADAGMPGGKVARFLEALVVLIVMYAGGLLLGLVLNAVSR